MRPVLFHIPLGFANLPLYSYGLMLALSLIVGWYITLELCERDGMDRITMGRCYMWTAGAALAGARLLYVFTNLDRFDNFFDVFKVWQGGLVAGTPVSINRGGACRCANDVPAPCFFRLT